MPNRTPQAVKVTEPNYLSVSQYEVIAKDPATNAILAHTSYAVTTGPTQTIPIGSNGFFDALPDGTAIAIYVVEHNALGAGPETAAQGNPVTLGSFPGAPQSVILVN